MRLVERAQRIAGVLEGLYPETPVPLDHTDPFTLLCAVMLSAQTTDLRVNLVTPALFARASTPEQLAAVPVDEVLALIRTCGLAPTKAKNLVALSAQLVALHGGQVPNDLEALEALPGVGHKTAQVVVAQAFGQPAFPVDTHIHRLALRWSLSKGPSVAAVERDLKAIYPPASWNKLHLQIIFFGREHCPAHGHEPADCPVCSFAVPERLWPDLRNPRAAKAKAAAKRAPAK